MQTIKATGIDWRERRLLSKLYTEKSDKVRLVQVEARNVKTGKGVGKRCCLSPIVFNLHSESPIKKALEGFGDFKAGRQVIHAVKYSEKNCVSN